MAAIWMGKGLVRLRVLSAAMSGKGRPKSLNVVDMISFLLRKKVGPTI
jgi:hypothetical protein